MNRISTLVAAVALLGAAGVAGAQTFHVDVPAHVEPVQSGLTRVEVLADLHLWRLAGLQDLTRGERPADANSYPYRKAYATYLYLRQSPQFALLVGELQRNPNARVVASQSASVVARAAD